MTTALKIGVESMSTSKFRPLGMDTRSPLIGAKSPPQVFGSEHLFTYLKIRPWVATLPIFAILISMLGLGNSPGLGDVLHLKYVGVVSSTTHVRLSSET